MERWIKYPFLRITIVLIFGVLAGIHFPIQYNSYLPLLLILPVIVISALYLFLKQSLLYSWNNGVAMLIFVSFFSLGYIRSSGYSEIKDKDHFANLSSGIIAYRAKIISPPEEKSKFYLSTVELERIFTDTEAKVCKGKVLLKVRKEDYCNLQLGETLLIKGVPSLLKVAYIPGSFDQKEFYSFKNIYHENYISCSDIVSINRKQSLYHSLLNQTTGFADSLFNADIKNPESRKVAAAMLLGRKSYLDDELKYIYSATGAMHILAVSGMHVGILYKILVYFLLPLTFIKNGKSISFIALCAVLVFYGAITGLSPAVNRAVFMFIFFQLARLLSRDSNPYNNLSIAAFVILLCDPFALMDLGFQLSFLALLGLTYFYPKLNALYTSDYYILRQAWSMTAASLAAQVFTLPLMVYYFKQFPLTFMAANILVIPASTLVIIFGISALCFGFIPYVAKILLFFTEYFVLFSNIVLKYLAAQSSFLLDNLKLNSFQLISLYLVILLLIAIFHFRNSKLVWPLTFVCLLFSCSKLHEKISVLGQEKLVIVKSASGPIGIISRGTILSVLALEKEVEPKTIKYSILPLAGSLGISSSEINYLPHTGTPFCTFSKSYELICYKGKRILFLKQFYGFGSPCIKVDYLICENNSKVFLNKVDKYFSYKYLILTKNKGYTTDFFKQNTGFHSLSDSLLLKDI